MKRPKNLLLASLLINGRNYKTHGVKHKLTKKLKTNRSKTPLTELRTLMERSKMMERKTLKAENRLGIIKTQPTMVNQRKMKIL